MLRTNGGMESRPIWATKMHHQETFPERASNVALSLKPMNFRICSSTVRNRRFRVAVLFALLLNTTMTIQGAHCWTTCRTFPRTLSMCIRKSSVICKRQPGSRSPRYMILQDSSSLAVPLHSMRAKFQTNISSSTSSRIQSA